jgi:AcrR family transcriptional regulator
MSPFSDKKDEELFDQVWQDSAERRFWKLSNWAQALNLDEDKDRWLESFSEMLRGKQEIYYLLLFISIVSEFETHEIAFHALSLALSDPKLVKEALLRAYDQRAMQVLERPLSEEEGAITSEKWQELRKRLKEGTLGED